MNKFYQYLSAAALTLFSLSAYAQTPEGLAFGYCGDHLDNIGSQTAVDAYWIASAFQMTEADVEQFDGCQITGISVGFGSGRNKAITIFMTYDLAEEPFFEQNGRVRAGSWNNIDITGAPNVEKGKPFYVGWRYHAENASAMPMTFDGNTEGYTTGADLLTIAYKEEDLPKYWNNYGSTFGNACIRLYLKGENLDGANCIPQTIAVPDFTRPGEEFDFTLAFSNASAAPVESVEVLFQVGDDDQQTYTHNFSSPVPANGRGEISITTMTQQDSFKLPITASISKVNGVANASASRSVTVPMVCTNGLFMRKMVCEKLTGQNCGYCPRGIVAFEHLYETVGDRFIPIEIHNYSSAERLYNSYYSPMLSSYAYIYSGAPSCTIDRDVELPTSPMKDSMYAAFCKEFTEASPLGIEVSFKDNGTSDSVDATATVTHVYGLDNADMAVTFVITEDNLLGQQYNGYNSMTGLPEWYGKGVYVTTYYNGVSRYIHSDWDGIDGSVPTTLEAGVPYSYTVSGLSLGNTTVRNNANIVALLIDRKTGKILNADMKHLDESRGYNYPEWKKPNDTPNEVTDIVADNFSVAAANGEITLSGEGSADVYNASGILMGRISDGNSLKVAPGLYIVSGNGFSKKLYVTK